MCPSESLSEFCWTHGSLPGCIISSATHSIFCVVRTVRFCPLLTFREIEFILSILCRGSLTKLTAQFLLGNSLQMRFSKFENGQKLVVFGYQKGKILKMNVETLLGNQSPPKPSSGVKNTAILPKMCSPELGKKSIKKKERKNLFLNIIFHPFATPTLLGRFVLFLAGRVTWPT